MGKIISKNYFYPSPSPILRKIKTQKTQIEDFEKIEMCALICCYATFLKTAVLLDSGNENLGFQK